MARPSTPAPKVLRLAVIADEVVSHQIHQTKPEAVSVGTSYRADLLVSGTRAPQQHRLFDVRQGVYYLDVPPDTRGKIRLGTKAITIAALRKRFGQGDRLRVKLDPRAKGKLLIGEATVLFQFAKPKPVAPKLPFPPIFKASVLGTLGTLLIVSQLISAGTLGPLFAWANFAPLPDESELEIEERFLIAVGSPKLLEQEEEEIPEEMTEDVLEQKDEEKVDEEKEPDEPKLAKAPEKYSEKAMQQARNVGVARVLGTYGGPGEGSVFDVISSTENNLGELFEMGMGTTVLADGGPIGDFVPGGEGISLRGSAVETQGFATGEGPALDKKVEKTERKVKASVKTKTSSITGGGDANGLRATINHRMRALRTCYENALRSDPNLGTGKHTYTIDISVMGSVTRVLVEEDTLGSPAVASCAKARIQGWRFRMDGADEGAEVTFTAVYSGQ